MTSNAEKPTNKFITLLKSSPEFKMYLEGRLNEYVSLPVHTMNVGSESEKVTFELYPRSHFKPKDEPEFFYKWFIVFKAHLWLFVFFPIFLVVCKNLADNNTTDFFTFSLTGMAAFFVALGLLLKSDYVDYFQGADRLDLSALKPLNQGWVSGFAVRVWSSIYFILGLILAIPASVKYNEMFRVTSVVAAIVVLTRLFKNNNYKFKKYYEVFFFILVGPALLSGLQVGMGDGIDTEILAIGTIWGLVGVFYLEIKNFENLLILTQMNIQNTITSLGFDKGKIFLIRLWLLLVVAMALYRFHYTSTFWFWFGLLVNLFFSFKLLNKINLITSPAGSELKDFSRYGRRLIGLFILIWVIENMFYIFV